VPEHENLQLRGSLATPDKHDQLQQSADDDVQRRYESAAALVADVGANEARALRTTPHGTDAIVATLGTDQFADAPLDKLQMLPAGAVSALAAAGIDTVGKLAARLSRSS
jgi:hypothetical protein